MRQNFIYFYYIIIMKHKTEDYKLSAVKYYLSYYAVKAVVDYGIEIQMVLKIFIRYHTII
jgi:hypothetical protein